MNEEQDTNEPAWTELAPALSEAAAMLREAEGQEQFRAVTRSCFNVLLSLARLTYDPEVHSEADEEAEDDTVDKDQQRFEVHHKLKPVIRHLFSGGKQKAPRGFVLNALKHAAKLHQKKAGTYGEAAQCFASTTAVVNMVVVGMGRRLD
jgi:hypothetical protein